MSIDISSVLFNPNPTASYWLGAFLSTRWQQKCSEELGKVRCKDYSQPVTKLFYFFQIQKDPFATCPTDNTGKHCLLHSNFSFEIHNWQSMVKLWTKTWSWCYQCKIAERQPYGSHFSTNRWRSVVQIKVIDSISSLFRGSHTKWKTESTDSIFQDRIVARVRDWIPWHYRAMHANHTGTHLLQKRSSMVESFE